MREVTFTLRVLTPLFLSGADQTTAELRAPSFRGLMRYWYRALISGIVGANEKALPSVMAAEAALFGATDRRSAVTIRISEASKSAQQYRKEGSRANPSGKDYFLWSIAESRRGKPDYKPDRFFFPQNTTFQTVLSCHSDDDAYLQQAVAALWLLMHLGGVGARSRRCAGSITAQIASPSFAGLRFDIPQNVEALHKQLSEGISSARKLALQSPLIHPGGSITQASFDALAPQICKIWIIRENMQVWSTPDNAMRALGTSLQNYRSQFNLQDREIFGLPLGRNTRRCASPLLLRIAELQQGGYVGIAVLFKTGNMQRYSLIEKWVDSFSGKALVTF